MALHDKANQALHRILAAKGTVQATLPPLGLAQTTELVSAAFWGADLAPELSKEIHDKTGGLPLYIEQASPICQFVNICLSSSTLMSFLPEFA